MNKHAFKRLDSERSLNKVMYGFSASFGSYTILKKTSSKIRRVFNYKDVHL